MAIELTALIITAGLLARVLLTLRSSLTRAEADNASLTAKLASAERVCEEQCRLLAEAGERGEEMRLELVEYRREEAARERGRFAFVIPHIPSETIAYPGCECSGCWRVRAGFN